jgi:probable rRNA maturation factor
VSFVTEDEMAGLHARYLGEEGATDVLSFEQDSDDGLIGDVVICPAFAARTTSAAGPDVDAELRLLLVHGVLHLLGYDHEAEDDRARMWARQESYSGVRVP